MTGDITLMSPYIYYFYTLFIPHFDCFSFLIPIDNSLF
ncbi:hypothetical protein yrohd0001_34340 [Yersinia rohdei ATCC 43380]|nr:hypothetical protein yrohd0001_34340 [Yersinia rohdei ATCC 43380]